MLRARAGNPPRQHLAALGDEAAQQLDVLVVDVVDLVRAELADFAPAEKSAATALVAALRVLVAGLAAAARAALLRSTKWHDAYASMSAPSNIMSPESSSFSPCGPSPGCRSGGNPRATRRRRDSSVRLVRARSALIADSSTRTIRWRSNPSVTLRRRSISFINSPEPVITSRT